MQLNEKASCGWKDKSWYYELRVYVYVYIYESKYERESKVRETFSSQIQINLYLVRNIDPCGDL